MQKSQSFNDVQKDAAAFDGEQFSTFILLVILIFLGFFGTKNVNASDFPIDVPLNP